MLPMRATRIPAMHPRFRLSLVAALALTIAAACATSPSRSADPVAVDTTITSPAAQIAHSTRGVVASATVQATAVGAQVLAEGGNAVDAAVATAFALAVTEPSMSGLGGRAAMLVRQPDGTVIGIDGLNQVPSIYKEKSGIPEPYERAAIPGVPAALAQVLAAHGTWPLARVLQPAIDLATHGFELGAGEAGRWAAAREQLLQFGAGRGTYLRPDGSLWKAGERPTNPLLAATLQRLSTDGVDAFYRGPIAEAIDADMRARGGFVLREELAAYRALPALVVRGTYRGHEIVSNFRPAAGQAVVQALHTLELVAVPPHGDEARWAAVMGQAMHWALADRSMRRGTEPESAQFLTSQDHARERAGRVVVPARLPASAHAVNAEPFQGAGFLYPPGTLVTAPDDREATTHLSVADSSGRVVTLTQSLGPAMGTRLVAPGLGFLFATRLGTTPGSRPASTVAPTLVVSPGGTRVVALGGAGDSRIISAVIQVVSRLLDHGLTLPAAMLAPRVHPDAERTLRVEDGPLSAWTSVDRDRLSGWGFTLVPSPAGFFGRVHAVEVVFGQPMLAVAEPRWTGGAAGPK
jgi:gamma-glutamyltranspeptidase/glutathione hydrolase